MYLTLLWTNKTKSKPELFDITEHEDLPKAVSYLIKNGANYEHQEIVTKVDWMPKGNPSSNENKGQSTPSGGPREEDPGPPPGTIQGGSEQPSTINTTPTPTRKKSIFDGILPPSLLPSV